MIASSAPLEMSMVRTTSSPCRDRRRIITGRRSPSSQGGDELLDAVVAALERVLAQHGALRLVVELEVDPVHGVVAAALFGPLDELAPQPCPRRLWRLVDGDVDLLVGAHALDEAAGLQAVEEAPLAVDVVVLKVDESNARVGERHLVAVLVGLHQLVLDDPVALPVELHRVVLQLGETVLPHAQRLLLEGAEPLLVLVAQGAVEVLGLDVERARFPPVRQAHAAGARSVVADLTDRPDRVLQGHVAQHHARVLEHPQHDRRGAHLEEGGVLAHVGVADDHVEPAEALGIGVGLVTRVDDRPRPRRRRGHALPDVLGPLADAVHRASRRLQHLARAGVDLAGHEERNEDLGVVAEVVPPARQVVLVAAVGVACRVGVVLEEVDDPPDPLLSQALLGLHQEGLQDALTRFVVHHQVVDGVALGGGVLGVGADVEVEPGTVLQEHVGTAAPRHDTAEQVARHLVGAQSPLALERARDAVLVLEPENPSIHWRKGTVAGMEGTRMVPLTAVPTEFAGRVLVAKLGSAGIIAEVRGISGVYPTVFDRPEVWVEANEEADARELITTDTDDAFDATGPAGPPARGLFAGWARLALAAVALVLVVGITLGGRGC